MNTKRKSIVGRLYLFVLFIASAAGILSATTVARAEERSTEHRTVRVAFPTQGGMSEIGTDGDLQGYNYSYLQYIAQYAGWDIEYVTYEDMGTDDGIMSAMEQTMTGEVDLLGPMLYSEQVAEMFEFPNQNYGVVYTTLCLLEKSDLTSVNYTQCNPLRVAVYASATTRNQEVSNYLDQQGVEYELIDCETTEEQIDKLQQGEADVLSSITLSYFEGTRTVAEFAPRPYYFVSTKGNSELIDELNTAIVKLNETQPDLQKKLQEDFFGDTSGGYVLSDDEKQYMRELQSIRVLCVPDYAPYCFQNNAGEPAGALVTFLNAFAEENQIKIDYTFCENREALASEWEKGDYDCMMGQPASSTFCIKNDLIQSASLISVAMELFGQNNTKPYEDSTVAIYGELAEQVNLDDFASVMECASLEECFDAVKRGKADYGCLNQLSADYEIFEKGYPFVSTPMLGEQIDTSIAVSNHMDSRFLSALNKYIRTLPDSNMTQFINEANNHSELKGYELFMRTQPIVFTGIVVVTILVFVMLIVMTHNAGKYKKWNAKIQEVNEQMKKATQAKSDFMSRMSHEIRTPLNAVIGYMTIAQMEDADEEKVQHCLENSELAAKHLLSIINDVLDVSAIESGKIKIANTDFNLKQQLSTIATIFYNQAKNRDVDFQVHIAGLTEEWVIGDQLRVNQIIMNLLSNAVKFTPENGHVELFVDQLEKTNEKVSIQFRVKDSGIGMSEEFLARMFTPFEQENAQTAQKYGGTGLGLAISKNLSTMMGGNIEVESKQNEGTTFTVTIPFGISSENEKVQSAQKEFSKIRVLVIDDREEEQSYVKEMLHRLGVKSDIASDGKAAVKRFIGRQNTDYAYDLCIIDWKMPELNGIEVARQIRKAGGEKMPIIIATAYDVTEIEKEAKENGVNQVIAKPLFQSTLFDLLVSTFGKYEPTGSAKKTMAIQLQGARILLAEDNEMNMEIAVSILTKSGIVIDTAQNGKEAVEKFEQSKPGYYKAILMDIQMPVMNGYEASNAIRGLEHPDAKTIPIIAMTANAFSSDVEAARANGMNGHIAKPIDYEKLYRTLNECINAAD